MKGLLQGTGLFLIILLSAGLKGAAEMPLPIDVRNDSTRPLVVWSAEAHGQLQRLPINGTVDIQLERSRRSILCFDIDPRRPHAPVAACTRFSPSELDGLIQIIIRNTHRPSFTFELQCNYTNKPPRMKYIFFD